MRPVLLWSDELLRYDFGPAHPMNPLRLELTRSLLDCLDLTGRFDVLVPPVATDDELALVHDRAYIAVVREAERTGHAPPGWGLGDADNPVFPLIHTAAARIAGGSLLAARLIVEGRARRAFSFAGGMHHAMPAAAAGFCVYNDVAIALAAVRPLGPVVYVDLDVHHGDGVQRAFESDPAVTTISLHQHPRSLYPHTGYPAEIGGGGGAGHAMNVALPEDVTDGQWLRALEAIAAPVLRELEPVLLVTQHGCDTHRADPLGGLGISIEAQREAARLLRGLAEEHCGGRWLAVGGGGYDVVETVPRVWAHVAAVVADADLDPAAAAPAAWRDHVRRVTGREAPATLGDGVSVTWKPFHLGRNPADAVDRAIMATRSAAFPALGLDPSTA